MKEQVTVSLDTGETYQIEAGKTLYEVAQLHQKNVKNLIIGAKIGNTVVRLDEKITSSKKIKFFDITDPTGYKMYQAGIKFVLEVAIKELYGYSADVSFSHSVARGMIADLHIGQEFGSSDVAILKNKMEEIVRADEPIEKLNTYKTNAVAFYQSLHTLEKAENIHNISNEVITYYRLHNVYNYFYVEMPYKTGVLDKFDLVLLDTNRISVIFPNPNEDSELPKYIDYSKVIAKFVQGKKWLDALHIPYISDINKIISRGKIEEIIRASEIEFDLQINKAAEDVVENPNIKIVLIAGPSSSGKTTCTKKLALNFITKGYKPIVISVDDYFLNREETPKDKDGNFDYECLEAIDVKLLNRDLQKLLEGKEADLPTFNFITGKREYKDHTVKLEENGIILMEGLHCLNDALIKEIPSEKKYKIYLSPFIPLNIDRHNYISTTDLRLIRRMVRDNRTRGYDVSATIAYWQQVRKGEEKYIFPYLPTANVVINTSLVYELNVLRVYAEPLLYSVSDTSPYYEEARRLINFLKMFFPIPSELVSKDSVLREFMGNGNFE